MAMLNELGKFSEISKELTKEVKIIISGHDAAGYHFSNSSDYKISRQELSKFLFKNIQLPVNNSSESITIKINLEAYNAASETKEKDSIGLEQLREKAQFPADDSLMDIAEKFTKYLAKGFANENDTENQLETKKYRAIHHV